MGYVKLRSLLKSRKITVREAATRTGVDLSKFYSCTAREKIRNDFTKEEKDLIYEILFSNSELSKEEVFERYEDTRFWRRKTLSSFIGR